MATYNALDTIAKYESGWRNVMQGLVPTSVSTAGGYWQITNTTWKSIAGTAGIDLAQYPTAISAPYDVQRKAAAALYERGGFSDWKPYNASLSNFIDSVGGAGMFGTDSEVASSSPISGSGTAVVSTPTANGDTDAEMTAPAADSGSWFDNLFSAFGGANEMGNATAANSGGNQTATTDELAAKNQDEVASIGAGVNEYFTRVLAALVGLIFIAGGIFILGRGALFGK